MRSRPIAGIPAKWRKQGEKSIPGRKCADSKAEFFDRSVTCDPPPCAVEQGGILRRAGSRIGLAGRLQGGTPGAEIRPRSCGRSIAIKPILSARQYSTFVAKSRTSMRYEGPRAGRSLD